MLKTQTIKLADDMLGTLFAFLSLQKKPYAHYLQTHTKWCEVKVFDKVEEKGLGGGV